MGSIAEIPGVLQALRLDQVNMNHLNRKLQQLVMSPNEVHQTADILTLPFELRCLVAEHLTPAAVNEQENGSENELTHRDQARDAYIRKTVRSIYQSSWGPSELFFDLPAVRTCWTRTSLLKRNLYSTYTRSLYRWNLCIKSAAIPSKIILRPDYCLYG